MSRELRWAETRVGMLEQQLKNLGPSLARQQNEQAIITEYDTRLRELMAQHPELKEAWDNFACLFQLAATKTVLDEANNRVKRRGCYLCFNDEERDEEDRFRSLARVTK